jgi:VWFA-related protein
MKITSIEPCLLTVPTPRPMSTEFPHHKLVVADIETDEGVRGHGYSLVFGGGGEGDLKKMSDETGGRVFKVDRKNSLDDIFKQIQDEMRSQYAIAYSPTNPKKDGTYRKLEFKMANKDYKVQARKGYYAVAN